MQEQEIWKDVVGYEGLYQVSNLGRVKSLDRDIITHHTDGRGDVVTHRKGIMKKIWLYKTGYLYTELCKDDVKKKHKIHRLVAMAFIENPNPEKYDIINHIDGNPLNNNVSNLEWIDNRGNQIHAIETGLNKYVGTNSYWSKLTEAQVKFIRENYKPRGEYNFCTMAKMFGVTPNTIQNVIRGKTYYLVK